MENITTFKQAVRLIKKQSLVIDNDSKITTDNLRFILHKIWPNDSIEASGDSKYYYQCSIWSSNWQPSSTIPKYTEAILASKLYSLYLSINQEMEHQTIQF